MVDKSEFGNIVKECFKRLKEDIAIFFELNRAEKDESDDFERWFEKVYYQLHGRYCYYLSVLRDLGGIALTSEIVKRLPYHKSTISLIEKDLNRMGIIGFNRHGKRKIVYLNHPSITSKPEAFRRVFEKMFNQHVERISSRWYNAGKGKRER